MSQHVYFCYLKQSLLIGLLILLTIPLPSLESASTELSLNPSPNTGSLYIIGFDAATWEMIQPLIKMGYLPIFQYLEQHGSVGYLETFYPTVSPAIWNSLITGRLPSEHGIESFVELSSKGEQTLLTSSKRNCAALWNIATDQKKSIFFSNWFTSYPAEKTFGLIVSDRCNYPELKSISYPEAILENTQLTNKQDIPKLLEKILDNSLINLKDTNQQIKALLDLLYEYLKADQNIRNLSKYFIKKYQPKMAGLYFRSLDLVGHNFQGFLEEEKETEQNPIKSSNAIFTEVLPSYYNYYDELLEEFTSDLTSLDHLIILSDHGMLSNAEDEKALKKLLGHQEVTEPIIISGPTPVRNRLDLDQLLELLGYLNYNNNDFRVDLEKSLAYDNTLVSSDWNSRKLYLSEKLSNQEAEELKKTLLEIRVQPLTSSSSRSNFQNLQFEPLIKSITEFNSKKREWLIKLSRTPQPGQIILIRDNKKVPFSKIMVSTPITGNHRSAPPGIFLAFGKNIKPAYKIEKVKVLDIMPTLLVLADLPISHELTGSVLSSAFLNGTPITTKTVNSYPLPTPSQKKSTSTQVDQEILDQLRALGYIQ